MSDGTLLGRFVWYELMTRDPEAAQGFYTKVIGWGTSLFEDAGMPYTMWTSGDLPLGGVTQLPEDAVKGGAVPHWLAYVTTPDVDATTRRGEELGGKVYVPPTDIPTVGRFSVLADPQGAALAPFTPGQPPEDTKFEPGEGQFSWHELLTTDHEAAFSFYSELFGWDKTDAMDMGEMGTYQMYGYGGVSLGGMYNKPAEMPGPPSWLYYIRVADVASALERVKAEGGQVLNGPEEVPGGDLVAQCMDPQGAAFALHSTA